ncbi:MAG: patatin-like phospholipase family protein [Spirochaetia bacterium]|nr:patatin-like phospholipase family protein [Spirochaetia bacterium]
MVHYRNLVFKGGGVRGIAYLGALQYLYEHNYMQYVERVAGTSAGAITALATALNLGSFDELKRISDSLDFRRVPAEEDERSIRNNPPRLFALTDRYRELALFKNLQCSMRLVQEKGWYSSDYFYKWLRALIAGQFAVEKEFYTFADFRDASLHRDGREFLNLYVTGTDITNRMARVFSFETTPEMEVALAVRISMSIPLFFEAIEYQYPGTDSPQLYADGGVMWNYPVNIFDEPRFGRLQENGINQETLGFFIFTSPDRTHYKPVKNMIDYVSALFESLLLVQEHLTATGEKNFGRTVFIDDCGVRPTDFDIDTRDDRYATLFKSGYEATKDFFSAKTDWASFFRGLRARLGWKEIG